MKNQLPKPVLRLVSIAVFSSVMFAAAPAAENPTHNQQAEVDTLEFKGRLEDFNKQTYVNKALSNSISKNDYLPLVVAEFVVSRVEKFPKIHEDQLRLEVNEVIASYNQELSIAMSGDNYKFTHQKFREIKAGVATAAVSKVAAVPVAIFHGVTEAGISAIEYVWGPIAQFNAQKENGPKRELLQANAPEIFAKLKDLSTKYDVVRNVDRDIISQYTSVFTQSNGFEVMKNDVAFANDARMQNFIKKVTDEGGNISEESKKELFSIIEARFVENNKLIAGGIASVEKMKTDISAINKYIEEQKTNATKQDEEKDRKEKFANLRFSAQALGSLVSIFDPSVGKPIGATLSAGVQIAEAISDYVADKAGNFAELALTGNIFGAISGLFGALFGGPSTDQLILEQIGELRKQVSELRKEMHGRFDNVDTKLDKIYGVMISSFDKVLANQKIVQADVEAAQRQLFEIRRDLSRLDQKTSQFFSDLSMQPTREAMFTCMGAEGTAPPQLTDSDYRKCLDTFAHCAINQSRDSMAVGFVDEESADLSTNQLFDQVVTDLKSRSAEDNIGLISAVARGAGNNDFAANGTVVSPSVWKECSKAYLTVAARWPRFYTYGRPDLTAAIISKGEQLDQSLRSVIRDSDFLDRLVTDTLTKRTADLKNAIDEARENFQLKEIADYDLILGTNQRAIIRASEKQPRQYIEHSKILACPDEVGGYYHDFLGEHRDLDIELPDAIGGVKGSLHKILADSTLMGAYLLGPEKLTICWNRAEFADHSTEWQESTNGPIPGNDAAIGRPWNFKRHFGRAQIQISVFVAGKRVFSKQIKSEDNIHFLMERFDNGVGNTRVEDIGNGESKGFPGVQNPLHKELHEKWSVLKGRILDESNPFVKHVNVAEVAEGNSFVLDIVEKKFAEKKSELNSKLFNSLQDKSLPNVEAAARRLTGAKLLISAFIQLSAGESWYENDKLRFLLTGKDGVFDAETLRQYIVETGPGSEDRPLVFDPKFEALSAERIALLRQVIDVMVKNETESSTAVADVLSQLKLLNTGHSILSPEVSIDDAMKKLKEDVDAIAG